MPQTDFKTTAHRPVIAGGQHVVAAGHYMAAQAGLAMLEAGGNAVDAGVAAGIATGVLEGIHVSVAGVAPILIYLAETKRIATISGLGTWPRKASAAYFQKKHGGKIPTGVERTVVPAAPDAWITALEQFGTMSFGEVAASAIRIAREGFPVYPYMHKFLTKHQAKIASYPSTAAIYLPGGRVPRTGEMFVQSDLAATLQYMADEEKAAAGRGRESGLDAARQAFYRGDIARKILAFHEAKGGMMTAEDLAGFRVGIEPALMGRFAGMQVYTCGPWCQGPMLLQELALLDPEELRALGHNSPGYVHQLTEAIKLAAADREAYYGDPRFVDVPMEALLSEGYSRERRAMIDPDRAMPEMPPAGRPNAAAKPVEEAGLKARRTEVFERSMLDTSYLCAIDRWGNAFSATPSDGNTEAPVIPGTGFVASGRGSQSRADPKHPSSVAPGKRPRLTPNPALAVFDDGSVMPFGTPGGDVQTQAMLQCLLNVSLFGMDMQSAVEAPRFSSYSFPSSFAPNDYQPGVLRIESRVAPETGEALARAGHIVQWWPDYTWEAGSICMIRHDARSGVKFGAADPRRSAYAVGW